MSIAWSGQNDGVDGFGKRMILVTGAAGFVGTALCKELRSRSVPVAAAVRTATDPSHTAVGDMTITTDWSRALVGCETVIHLAARVHVMRDRSEDSTAAYRHTNVDATLNLATQAVNARVRRFVFVSSIKVNGESTSGTPFTAHDAPGASDAYGLSKAEAENALRELARQTGLEVVILRPPLVYGPGVRANFLRLMQLVKLGLPLPFGGVSNRRSMVALDNLVDLLILCSRHPAANGQTFLVSDGQDLSTPDLIRLIAQAMGKRPLLPPIPVKLMSVAAKMLNKSDVANRLLGSLEIDITPTKRILEWQPVIQPKDAVLGTVLHFLAHNDRRQ